MLRTVAARKVINNFIFTRVLSRNCYVWSGDRVVSSRFNDVVIPDLTINDYVWSNIDKWPEKTAIICSETKRRYTYEQLYKQSQIFAAHLRKQYHLKDGDNVAMVMSNVPEFAISLFGVLKAGGVASLMNPIYTVHEVYNLLKTANAKLFIVTPETVPVVKATIQLIKRDIPIICVDINNKRPENTISFKELIDTDTDLDILKSANRNAEDVALLPFSSGTTGLPKGVELTHRNIVANCEQQNTECRQHSITTASTQDTILGPLPLFHSFGLSVILLHKLSVGLQIVQMPRFRHDVLLNALNDFNVNIMYLVPPMVLHLGSSTDFQAKQFRELRSTIVGGAPLAEADMVRFLEKNKRDIHFSNAYGLTETSPLATINPIGIKNYESVGVAVPNVKLRVINDEFGNLGPNEVGELLIQGPNIMKGYKDNPKANSEVFEEDKWFRSGDLARIDEEGFVYIVGRLKELIKVNAYQVAPAELENVIKEHPSVFDVAVIGVPDEKTGEKPKAFIVVNNKDVKEQEIMDFVAERVAPFKKLKEVSFIDSIPKNPTGKILRKVLKEKL